jgi:integrase
VDYEFRHREVYKNNRIDVKANSPRELTKKVNAKKKKIDRGLQVEPDADTVKKWAKRWLSSYIYGNVADSTYQDIKSRVDNKIVPVIGHMKLVDVKPINCKDVMDTMEGYSRDRVNKVYHTMYQMFKMAQSNWYIDRNPAEDVPRPAAKNGRGRALSKEEVEWLRKVCKKHPYGDWALTMLETGARPGETYLSRWCHLKNGGLFIDGTKTANAKRTVPVPDDLYKRLEARRKGPFDFIFLDEKGRQMNKSTGADAWQSILRAMQISAGTTLVDEKLVPPYKIDNTIKAKFCRHTYATMLKDASIPFTIMQELLGHATGTITDNYLHATETSFDLAARLLKEHRESLKKEAKKKKVSH